MNTKQAKKIPMVELLKRFGFNPVKETSNSAWYHSPLNHDDKTPSFKVNKSMNAFYCFSTAEKGTNIDLVMKLFNVGVSDALKRFENFNFSFRQQKQIAPKKGIEIHSVKPIKNKHLIQYAQGRCISHQTLMEYCKEVYFTINKKNLYAIGFKNIQGGYELRNSFFKGCASPKDVTLIKNGNERCAVFEGFFDFLSFIELKKEQFPSCDYLILNSNTQAEKSLEKLRQYKRLFLFLDNNDSGIKTTQFIQSHYDFSLDNYSHLYHSFGDLNEYLVKYKRIKTE